MPLRKVGEKHVCPMAGLFLVCSCPFCLRKKGTILFTEFISRTHKSLCLLSLERDQAQILGWWLALPHGMEGNGEAG